MTRFDASTPSDRRGLFAEAIVAHRNRGSEFVTIEPADRPPEADEDEPLPWVQFEVETVSMDCTDEELERLKSLVSGGEFPEFRIDELISPEEADGTHARVSARSDPNRLAMFVDRVFQTVYGYDEAYTAYVVNI